MKTEEIFSSVWNNKDLLPLILKDTSVVLRRVNKSWNKLIPREDPVCLECGSLSCFRGRRIGIRTYYSIKRIRTCPLPLYDNQGLKKHGGRCRYKFKRGRKEGSYCNNKVDKNGYFCKNCVKKAKPIKFLDPYY